MNFEATGGYFGAGEDSSSQRLNALHDIIVVHAIPLLRQGLVSAITDAKTFVHYHVSAFPTFTEAASKISKAVSGDVIVLDPKAWSLLTANADHLLEFERIKAAGLSIAVIASRVQHGICDLETSSSFVAIAQGAELDEFVEMIEALAVGCQRRKRAEAPKVPPLSFLSARQMEVLKLMSQGLSNKQIAHELGIGEGTIKFHSRKIFEKLRCRTRVQAIMTLMQNPHL